MTEATAKELPRHWSAIRQHWRILTFYQRFEASLAYLLTFVIGAVVVVALGRLVVSVVNSLVLESLNPLEHSVFQRVFGEIMTLLIAMEFNHTLRYEISREWGVIQTRVVILIALLALARKVVILDVQDLTPAVVLSLGILTFSLGATYWLIRDPETRGPAARGSAGMERTDDDAISGSRRLESAHAAEDGGLPVV